MIQSDLWPRIERLLPSVERPVRYIDHEYGARSPVEAGYRAALMYPDVYEIGQSNSAIAILYDILGSQPDVAVERVFLPWVDMADAMRREGVPLFSLESCSPVSGFDLLGITIPYELTYSNILEALDLAGIPLRSSDRDESHPIVVGGGPCVYNPEPLSPFFDAVLIGEGEEAVLDIVAAHRECRDSGVNRAGVLMALARIPGVYVPSLYEQVVDSSGRLVRVESLDGAPDLVSKRVLPDLASHPTPARPIVPFMDVVHDRVGVEVLRGCTRGCRFCQAGMVYRPVRERPADDIVREALSGLACTGYDDISLTSLSTADHSRLEEILRRLTTRLAGSGTSVSLPSLRVDAFSVDMARLIAGAGRKSGLTFAPEAGTQRLRDVINKNVTEDDLLETVRHAFGAGWRRLKLYFMIGLPTETDDDIRGIGELVSRVLEVAREVTPPAQRGSIRVAVSVSTFVPKAQTPFQWHTQATFSEVAHKQTVLRETMPRRGVDLSWHDAETSYLEGVMARGDRSIAALVEEAWRRGARFDGWTERFDLGRWTEAMSALGMDVEGTIAREWDPADPLPWDHISAGVSKRYLLRERERSLEGLTTKDCSFSGCTGCDVCGDLGVDIVLDGERV